jgi:hypothetical protein
MVLHMLWVFIFFVGVLGSRVMLWFSSNALRNKCPVYWLALMMSTTDRACQRILGVHTRKTTIRTGRLQAGTADQEAVNVGLLGQLGAVLLVDAAAVQDAGLLGDLGVDVVLEPGTDGGVDVLGLGGGGDLAGADGPDGLVGDDDLGPVGELGLERGELLADDVDGGAGLALLEALAAAPDDADAVVGGVLGLGGDDLVGLAEDGTALRVAEDGPVDAGVLELGDGDLASEGAAGLVEDVLGGDGDLLAEELAGGEEVERGRGDDDLCMEELAGEARGVESSGRERHVPVLGSRLALLRFSTISLMDDTVPFLDDTKADGQSLALPTPARPVMQLQADHEKRPALTS